MIIPLPRRMRPPAAAVAAALLAVGCSGKADVTGRVHYPDGSPLDRGLVICEPTDGEFAGKISARGVIQPDGSFRLGVDRAAEGVPPGKYKVLVMPRMQSEEEVDKDGQVLDPRYTTFATSGLTVNVAPGGAEMDITVTRGAPPNPKAAGKPSPVTNNRQAQR